MSSGPFSHDAAHTIERVRVRATTTETDANLCSLFHFALSTTSKSYPIEKTVSYIGT